MNNETDKTKRFRVTKTRKEIIELLAKTSHPLSAREMLQKLSSAPHKTTIYREIEFLLSQKMIEPVFFTDGVKRYESVDRQHHHHVTCTTCGAIKDVVLENDFCNQDKNISKLTQFSNLRHSLEFFGTCVLCQKG